MFTGGEASMPPFSGRPGSFATNGRAYSHVDSVSIQTPSVSAKSPQAGPTQPIRGNTAAHPSVAAMRSAVARLALPDSRLLNSTAIGTFLTKNPMFITLLKRSVSREISARSAGRLKNPSNTHVLNGGRAGMHCSATRLHIMYALSRRNVTYPSHVFANSIPVVISPPPMAPIVNAMSRPWLNAVSALTPCAPCVTMPAARGYTNDCENA